MPRRYHTKGLRRSGCTNCKSRHKKCGEEKPRCRNCVRRNLPCDQPDVFRIAMLNIARTTRPAPPVLVPSYDDLPVIEEVVGDEAPEYFPVVSQSTSPTSTSSSPTSTSSADDSPPSPPSMALTIQPDASQMERYLLHHYTFLMSSILINVDSPTNPLRSVLLPRAVIFPGLKDALYAVAALHVSVGKDDPEFRITSLAYHDKALTAFHERISQVLQKPNRAELEVLLLTAVFLCKYEIISGGVSNWRSHLQGLKEMLEAFQSSNTKLATETTSYVQSFIQYHSDVATITQSSSHDSPTSNSQDLSPSAVLSPSRVDPYMGTSAKYISLLRMAAEAIALDPMLPGNVPVMMTSALHVYTALQIEMPPPDPFDDFDRQTMTFVRHIAQAYRNAVVAYLHMILNRIEGHETSIELMLQTVGMRTLLATTKEDALSACVQEMQCVPDDQSCAVGLVPLLFIVASETRNLTEFNIGTQRLTRVFQTACLGNIVPTLELLHETRRTKTRDWREVLKAFHWDLIVV